MKTKSQHITAADQRSPEWRRLQQHIEQRLLTLRGELETLDADVQQTATTRGRINELRMLQDLQPAEHSGKRLAARLVPEPLEPGAMAAQGDSDTDSF